MIEWLACLTHNLKFVSSNPSLTIMFCLRPREGEGLGGGGGFSPPPHFLKIKLLRKSVLTPTPTMSHFSAPTFKVSPSSQCPQLMYFLK